MWPGEAGLNSPVLSLPENKKRLFDKFYRIIDPRIGRQDGTGLGLVIVKRIVNAHQGEIWVDSLLNKGSSFYFSLPLADKNKD